METIQSARNTKALKEHKCNFCQSKIEKSTMYVKSVHKYEGTVYAWKTHIYCAEIASKLNMYDMVDEGLTGDDFIEAIQYEYSKLMSSTQNELWESPDFEYPKFQGQLQFVLNYHNVPLNPTKTR